MTRCSYEGCDVEAHFVCNTCVVDKDTEYFVCEAHALAHEQDSHDGMGMYGFKPM